MQAMNTLDRLKKIRANYDAKIKLLEARTKIRERKLDTRRKILIGAYYLDKARKENKYNELVKIMRDFLKRNSDQDLFEYSQ
jgi:hypothetical protein